MGNQAPEASGIFMPNDPVRIAIRDTIIENTGSSTKFCCGTDAVDNANGSSTCSKFFYFIILFILMVS